jgi:epidermal growth factor receptor kinase substrate 8
MPSIQTAKNAYIAKNQMELQQYQQLLQQYNHQNQQQQFPSSYHHNHQQQQLQQQQSKLQNNKQAPPSASKSSSVHPISSHKNPSYSNNNISTTVNSKLQSKAIANEIALNKNVAKPSDSNKNNNNRKQQAKPAMMPPTHLHMDENNSTMNNDKKYVKRGTYSGPMYDVDHLATFTVGSKLGLIKAEDGMRKLRIMEKSQGIWTMECQLMVDNSYLIIYDKKNGQEVEMFPLSLVNDPTSVISDDKKDVYNNILLFTVLDDKDAANNNKKKSSSTTKETVGIPSEMHIFQCTRTHSAEIVDEIYRAKEGRRSQPVAQLNGNDSYKSPINETTTNFTDDNNNISNRSLHRANHKHATNNDQTLSSKIDIEVQILNHCFDDIERFVTRLQNSSEYFKELERRQKQRTSSGGNKLSPGKHMKSIGDGMLSFRAQMPPTQHFVDIFQKFKFSFNLLAKLKAHIHDPNAPELIHFLFTPLSLIVNTTKEQPYRGLTKTVWTPLLTKDTKDLLLNCLTSKEQDLWMSLGDSWTITQEEAKLQPHVYGHLENQVYQPVFYDGWSPQISNLNENTNLIDRLAFSTAAQIQAQASYNSIQVPIQKNRNYINTQPQLNANSNGNSNSLQEHHQQANNTKNINSSKTTGNNISVVDAKVSNIRNYEEMQKWAMDLAYRGAKVYEVTHDRQANNDKELTIKSGELLEVLDDKRNWWKLRNFYGNVGHAPVTILRSFEISSLNHHHQANPAANNTNGFNSHHQNSYHEQDKVGYF